MVYVLRLLRAGAVYPSDKHRLSTTLYCVILRVVAHYVCCKHGFPWCHLGWQDWLHLNSVLLSTYSLNPHWILQPEVMETYLQGTGKLVWGWDPLLLRYLLQFLSATIFVWDQLIPHGLSWSHSWNGFFFNSVFIGLPSSSISHGSEWWLLYNLVVILMWLCEEVSYILELCHFWSVIFSDYFWHLHVLCWLA